MLLVFLGFAHRQMASALAASPVELAAYALPDGTLPTLCLPDEAGGKSGKVLDRDCEACRISAASALPDAPADAEPAALAETDLIFADTPEAFHRLDFPPGAPPRGPPSVPFSIIA